MPRKPASTAEILKLKVTLADIRPPVWRRLLVPADMTLGDLHLAIQAAMGWHNSHLHDFDTGLARYGDPGTTDDVEDEHKASLSRILGAGTSRLRYTYDFGDDWVHLIVAEGTVPREEGRRYPACLGGKRACPPEDCGGPFGLANLLEAQADPSHPDHAEMSEWLAGDYDPSAFSVAEADARLAEQFSQMRRRR